MVRTIIPAAVFLLASGLSAAIAQQSPGPRLDPTQLEKNFETYRREQERSRKSDVPVPIVAPQTVGPAGSQSFRLTSIVIEGATAISADELAPAYSAYLGRTISESELAAIANAVSALYRNAGFHLSRAIIPAQEIKNGHVRIKLIEGSIHTVSVEGSHNPRIKQLLEPVTAERPSRLGTLERQLLLINDTPGMRVEETGLEEIGLATGNFRLTLRVKAWAIYSAAALDNWGVPAIGPLQSHFAGVLSSPFIPGDAAGFNFSVVPDAPRELTFGRLWYEAPVGLSGARFGFSASYGEIWPNDERRLVATRTVSETLEARLTTVPRRTRTSSLWLTAGMAIGNFSEREDTGFLYKDYVRAVSLGADYQVQDTSGAWNYVTLTFRQGLPLFGASERGDPALSRIDGSAEFSKLEFAVTRLQPLNDNWSARFATAGQIASTALLSSQEFYLGGLLFGRGYEAAEISGDNGIAGAMEIRFDQKVSNWLLESYQLYGFVDGGAVRDFRAGSDRTISLSSAGGGVRFYFKEDFQADVGIAFPLTYRTITNDDHSPRVYFVVAKAFKFCPHQFRTHCS
jgi:hemolysin activation/secretion protein